MARDIMEWEVAEAKERQMHEERDRIASEGCPTDIATTASAVNRCGVRHPNLGQCSRPTGHARAHHAHNRMGGCLGYWFDDPYNIAIPTPNLGVDGIVPDSLTRLREHLMQHIRDDTPIPQGVLPESPVPLNENCPPDSFTEVPDMRCGARYNDVPRNWTCTRLRDHDGEHHAHSRGGVCRAHWPVAHLDSGDPLVTPPIPQIPPVLADPCPDDANNNLEPSQRCTQHSSSGNVCTRPRGHAGSHHAHSLSPPSEARDTGHCYEAWANTPTTCPPDADTENTDMLCGVHYRGLPLCCTRLQNHQGDHHAHVTGLCVQAWSSRDVSPRTATHPRMAGQDRAGLARMQAPAPANPPEMSEAIREATARVQRGIADRARARGRRTR
jgi:hypothetical protein